jgi:hypothetical protein
MNIKKMYLTARQDCVYGPPKLPTSSPLAPIVWTICRRRASVRKGFLPLGISTTTKKRLVGFCLVVILLSVAAKVTMTAPLASTSASSEGWTVTTLATTGAYVNPTHGQQYFKGVIFKDNLVFWRIISSREFAITAFSLSNFTLRDLFDFTSPNVVAPYGYSPTTMKTVDDAVFAVYGYSGYPVFNTTILRSTDLETWTEYCVSNTMFAESMEQYTGPGVLNGFIEYGGFRSDGGGTYSIINAWNTTSNSEIHLFSGRVYGSDDVTYLRMFNETCMIGGDAYPYDVLFTNDGQDWTDPYTGVDNTPQYPFDWSWNAEIRNGTAYTTAEPYSVSTGHGGLVKWNGTATPFDYGKSIESIANGLIGGCDGLYNTKLNDFPGPAAIYEYSLDGTLGSPVWKSDYTGSVSNLIYDPNSAAWYAFVLRRTAPESVTIMKISQEIAAAGISHDPTVAWVGENVLFHATVGYDSYAWDFGDGNVTISGQDVNHAFENVGNFTAMLRVAIGDATNSTAETILVTFITDLNKDGIVNVLDVSTVAKAYDSKPSDINWNPLADLNEDGIINIVDISMVAIDVGKAV